MSETASTQSNHVVQQLAADGGDELPERYVYKDADKYGAINTSPLPMADIPVIDFTKLLSSSEVEEELEKLMSAVSSWGCFQAINHGIESSFLDKLREIAKQFFALPMEEKTKYLRPDDNVEGYGNDMVLSDNQTLDWTDRLYLHVIPEDQRKLKYWPEKPDDFRKTLHEYTSKLQSITANLLKALARSLNLDENCFLKQYGENASVQARFNYYPPCRWPDKILGVKPHADGSAITILLQDDEVEGLQVLKEDQWFRVPIIPHALFVNVGDQIEIMSNGIYKSPVHRVSTNSEKERISLAMFYLPGSEIGPAEELISKERPRLYKNVTFSLDFYFQNYQQGKRPIDAARL